MPLPRWAGPPVGWRFCPPGATPTAFMAHPIAVHPHPPYLLDAILPAARVSIHAL